MTNPRFEDEGGPTSLAIDPLSGNIAVSLWSNTDRIQLFDSEGTLKLTFGEVGLEEGQLSALSAKPMTFDNHGNIVIIDGAPTTEGTRYHKQYNRFGIHVFDSKGTFLRRKIPYPHLDGERSGVPGGIGIDPSTGNILVLNGFRDNSVTILTPNLELVKTVYLKVFNVVTRMRMDANGHMVVADSRGERIHICNTEGEILKEFKPRDTLIWSLLTEVTDVVLDWQGNVLIAGSHGGIELYG